MKHKYKRKNLCYSRSIDAGVKFQKSIQKIKKTNKKRVSEGRKIIVNKDFKGASVTFDDNVTHQMEIINGLRPRENLIKKSMIASLSKKMIEAIGEQAVHERESKLKSEIGQELLNSTEN